MNKVTMKQQCGLPRAVKVDEFYYKVISWDPKDAGDVDRYGETSIGQKVIRIDESYGPHQTAETLIHELLHVLFNRRGLQEGKPGEERIVRQLAMGLSTILHDNPTLGQWLLRGLR